MGIVRMLISYHVDLELKDNKDNTPLLLASGVGLEDICDLLISMGANPNVKNYLRKSCAQKACGSSSSTMRKMVSAGSEMTYVAASGQTRNGVSVQRCARYVMAGTDDWQHRDSLRTGSHTGSRHCSQGPGTDSHWPERRRESR